MKKLLTKPVRGERLTAAEALTLYREADLLELGAAAAAVKDNLHPSDVITFVGDRNINYTNVCATGCLFCAFHRRPGHPEGYVLTMEEVVTKVEEAVATQATQILIQGGVNPALGLSYFTGLFRALKGFPIHIHSLSPVEIAFLAEREHQSVADILVALRDAGLDSLPGGGAEILVDRPRSLVSPRKLPAAQWLEIMETAQGMGMKTTATMVYGAVETPQERIQHLLAIRELQDKTGGFTAFIPWSYQPKNTRLGGEDTGGAEYLRMLALSRLVLDNVPNLQVSWVTQGLKLAQVALSFGANDFGGTMMEENVVRAAGVSFRAQKEDILAAIREAGYRPAQRDTYYRILREF